MSEPGLENQTLAAEQIRARAAEWLARRVSEDWRAEDQEELDRWLAQSPSHRVAYLRVNGAWGHTYRLAALRGATTEPAAPAKRSWTMSIAIAASFALIATLGISAAYVLGQPRDRVFTTPVGGHETISFADGSKIELNTDTVLRTRMTTEKRTVWLEKGEAFFEVKHDPAHPFVVLAGDHRVTDLGTKFLVRRDPGRLEVALLEGRVRFGEADEKPQSQSRLLLPGEVATATSSTMFVAKETAHQLARELSWRRGVLVFDKTPLADAASEINRYNKDTKLVIADPAAAGITIDGAFPANDIRVFLEAAQTLFGLRVEKHGDQVVISR